MGGGDSYDVTVNQIQDNVLWRMLYKGYMGSSYQDWGLECDDDLYYATKTAVHSMAEGVSPTDKYEVATRVGKFDSHISLEEVQRRSRKVLEVAQAIYDFGYSGTENYIKPQVNLAKNGGLKVETIDGTKYVVQNYNVTANKELGSYRVSIESFPSGTKILNSLNAETQTMYNSNFKIAIPTNNLSENTEGLISITEAKVKTYPIFYADSNNSNTQNYVTYADPSEDGSTSTELYVKANDSTLVIKKVDENGNGIGEVEFNIKYADGTNIGNYTTDSNGFITISDLKLGSVIIKEISGPEKYVLDETEKTVELEYGNTSTINISNDTVRGYIQVVKKDIDTGKTVKRAGTQFEILSNGRVVSTISTNSNGVAKSDLLEYGTYTIREKHAPYKYTIAESTQSIDIKENGKVYEINLSNKRTLGTINLSKIDKITGKTAQGEATLQGAVYGLYAKEPILDPADDSVIYNRDEKVGNLITDSNGNATMEELYLGKYYLKELVASTGYNLDTTIYDLELSYENQNVKVVTEDITVKERVISQAFEMIKISSDDVGEAELLEGVEFTIKAQKDIDKYGSWEKAPIAKNDQGIETKILKTDAKGYAVSERLPFGTYIIRETKVPDNKYKVPDFKVVVTKDSAIPQTWRIFNDTSFMSVLAIVKQDAETGKTVQISGAKFKIKNRETGEYFGYWSWNPLPHYVDSWETTEDGTVMTNEQLRVGKYQLEEIKSPNGYLVSNKPIEFEISSYVAYQALPDGNTAVITIKQKDTSVKGKVNIEKRGEVLVGFENGQFIYEERGLQGAKYEIFARENILAPSNDGTILYKKGTVVDTVITNTNGQAVSKELPLGEYSIREVLAPNGMVINSEIKDVSLKYKDQNTAIVYDGANFVNERQKVNLNVTKKDFDENIGLSGATFGIYAKGDIYNYDNEVVLEAGTLIQTAISDELGNVHFTVDLPLENFEVKEIQAPIGYSSSNKVIEVDATYRGQEVPTIELQYELKNKIIEVEVSKKDITDNSEIAGAYIKVFEKDNEGAIFEEWISGQDGLNEDGTVKPHIMKGLEVGKTYVMQEVSSPHGFAIAQDVEFTIEDTSKIQKVEMKDEVVFGELEWNKTGEIFMGVAKGNSEFGEIFTPAWHKSNLLDTEITIYADEDIKIGNTTYYKKDEKVETLESDWEKVVSKRIPVGKYYYMETKTPFGYVGNTDKHYFEVKDNQKTDLQIISSTLNNNRARVNIELTKVLEEQNIFINNEAYKDIKFGIYAREDLYDYMGNVAIENNSLVAVSGIDEKGHLVNIPDLPIGTYFIKELSTNSQYVLDQDKEYSFEISYRGKTVAEYTIQINHGIIENKLARGKIQIVKKDNLDENKKLENVEFDISADKNMKKVIMTAKTDENGIATFENLELGTYYIRETKQVEGYISNDYIYEVEVKEDGDLLKIEVYNQPTKMEFSKVDETNTNELPGATLQIIDKETGEIIEEWVSTNEPHIIHYLQEGKEYVMREETAPYGYTISEEITFIAGDGQKIVMQDMPILKTVKIVKTDSDTNEVIKADFKFGIYEDAECTKLIKEVNSDKENGTVSFEDLRYGTYFIKELKAPGGYQLSDKVIKIEINDRGTFANGELLEDNDSICTFTYSNKLIPKIQTGNEVNIMLLIGSLIISLLGIVVGVIILKKKNK